jgi:hypothetical protein
MQRPYHPSLIGGRTAPPHKLAYTKQLDDGKTSTCLAVLSSRALEHESLEHKCSESGALSSYTRGAEVGDASST